MKYFIKNNERGLLFKNGNYINSLQPGKYSYSSSSKYNVIILDINQPFACEDYSIDTFIDDKDLLKELAILDVKDSELAFHYVDGKFSNIYESGNYVFWNITKKNEFKIVDMTNTEMKPDERTAIFNINRMSNVKRLKNKYLEVSVRSYEKALLFYDNKFQKILEPGKYYYWTKYTDVSVEIVDIRQQQLDMMGQEIMTADKVTLRINFSCQYKIVDILKTTLKIKDHANQIYILVQLILREYLGGVKLDDLLKSKQDIADYVLSKLKDKEDELGIKFIFAGIKDVILPGEIKQILNTVLIAEKKAQANVITRREEIASTRSLLNTAKLMDENKTLYKLKELEHIEKICEKIGNISLDSGNSVLDSLGTLFRGV